MTVPVIANALVVEMAPADLPGGNKQHDIRSLAPLRDLR